MAKEIEAVTIPELPEGALTGESLMTFAGTDGTMYKTTATSVAAIINGEVPTPSDITFEII